jgi:hypothetical protein
MNTPHDSELLSTADLVGRVNELEERAVADQATIAELEERAAVDRAVIAEVVDERQADRDKIANLEAALASARRIGTALGIVMAGNRITDDEAFDVLRRVSQTKGRKLRDLAEEVILTGEVDYEERSVRR